MQPGRARIPLQCSRSQTHPSAPAPSFAARQQTRLVPLPIALEPNRFPSFSAKSRHIDPVTQALTAIRPNPSNFAMAHLHKVCEV
jgi:hypothetical protein